MGLNLDLGDLTAVAKLDPGLHAQVVDLCALALEEVQDIITDGTLTQKEPFLKMLVSTMTRPTPDKDKVEDTMAELRDEMLTQNRATHLLLLNRGDATPVVGDDEEVRAELAALQVKTEQMLNEQQTQRDSAAGRSV